MENVLRNHCLSKPHVIEDFQVDWDAARFFVGGKMFALFGCNKDGKPIVTLKCDPAEAGLLRSCYPDVIPGYHMNKAHWNSVFLEGNVPEHELFRMIDNSYALVVQALPQKARRLLSQAER